MGSLMKQIFSNLLISVLILLSTPCFGEMKNSPEDGTGGDEPKMIRVERPDDDIDLDDVIDAEDNCPTVPNPDQRDSNHNDIGDECE